jgi:hypothetical protein
MLRDVNGKFRSLEMRAGIRTFLSVGIIVQVLLVSPFADRPSVLADEVRDSNVLLDIPAFVDNTTDRGINAPPFEHLQEIVWKNNIPALHKIAQLDREAVRKEMIRRVNDEQYPMRLRNLAAAILLVRNDDTGRKHLRQKIEPLTVEGVGALWLIGYFAVYGSMGQVEEYPDMEWAEDLMIDAIKNRTTLSRDAICRCNYIQDHKTVEVRELAVREGNFAEILAKMKSRKAFPVLLALIEENHPFIAPTAIEHIGKFEDKSLEPLILGILEKYDDRFDSAVISAISLKMHSAVPYILDHPRINSGVGYSGLEYLAEASDLPRLREKLNTLEPYKRDDFRLLILKLEGGDPVPQLLSMLRDHKFQQRWDVVRWLSTLKDERAVKDLGVVLKSDPGDSIRLNTIWALRSIASPSAVEALISALGADFTNVRWTKSDMTPQKFRKEIADSLKEMTGQDFGQDRKAWKTWFASTHRN